MKYQWCRILCFLLVTIILSVTGMQKIKEAGRFGCLQKEIVKTGAFRKQRIDDTMQKMIEDRTNPGELLGIYWLESEFGEEHFQGAYTEENIERCGIPWKRRPGWEEYAKACRAIWNDLVYFPIPASTDGKTAKVSFVDSWMYERNYGGTRGHEGTDIMAEKNIRGYYPVVSMTDGYVTHKGWLEQGGYRLGITAPGGAYFYYAHLDSYAEIEEGDFVKAGDLIGFMGDTGYSKKEGTTGMFPVHLHVGIYLICDGEEISVNPYQPLKYLEKRKIECIYNRKKEKKIYPNTDVRQRREEE